MTTRLLVLALGAAAAGAFVAARRRASRGDSTRNGGRERTEQLRREIEQARRRLREDLSGRAGRTRSLGAVALGAAGRSPPVVSPGRSSRRNGSTSSSATRPCPGCRPSSTGSRSFTSPTSIWAPSPSTRGRSSGPSSGRRAGPWISSRSRAISSAVAGASALSRAPWLASTGATALSPFSGTTTSPRRAIRSRAPRTSRRSTTRKPICSSTRRARSSCAAAACRSSAATRAVARSRWSPWRTRAPTSACSSPTSRTPSSSCRPGAFHLVLAGHLHGGQICLPTPQRQAAAPARARPVLGGPLPAAAGPRCTSRAGSARASCRSVSWRGRKRRCSRSDATSTLA